MLLCEVRAFSGDEDLPLMSVDGSEFLDWNEQRRPYKESLQLYCSWLGLLVSNYFSSCRRKISRDGITGAIVVRAAWDTGNLIDWIDAPLPLVAYCTRSLLELVVSLQSIERTGDWRSWFGFMAKDYADLINKVSLIAPESNIEASRLNKERETVYANNDIPLPERTPSVQSIAKIAGLSREYNEINRLLSKFVHPTALALLASDDLMDSTVLRRYFLARSMLYVNTI